MYGIFIMCVANQNIYISYVISTAKFNLTFIIEIISYRHPQLNRVKEFNWNYYL